MKDKLAGRMQKLAPYLFAELDRKKVEAQASLMAPERRRYRASSPVSVFGIIFEVKIPANARWWASSR